MADYNILKSDQRTMKKMPYTRKYDNGQLLRPRPVHHIIQHDKIVFLSMHHQRVL